MKSIKLGTKLIWVNFIIIATALLITNMILLQQAEEGLSSLMDQQLELRSANIVQGIDTTFNRELKLVTMLANMDSTVTAFEALTEAPVDSSQAFTGLNEEMQRIYGNSFYAEGYQGCIAMAEEGVVLASSNPGFVGVDVKDRDYFQAGWRGQNYVSLPAINRASGMPFVSVAVPIKNREGAVVGVMANLIDISYLNEIVKNSLVGKTGYSYIIDENGLIIAHPDSSLIVELNILEEPGMEILGERIETQTSGVEHYYFRGDAKSAGFYTSELTRWTVLLVLPTVEYMESINSIRVISIIIAIITLFLAGIVMFFFSRSISRPIQKVSELAKKVAQGDLTIEFNQKRGDEIGDMFRSLSNMVEKLSEVTREIQHTAESLEVSSKGIAESSDHLADGANQQAAAAEEVSSSVEEMDSSIQQNSRSADKTNEIAQGSAEEAENSGMAVYKTVEAMETISERISIIEEIARQTNLLALNAAIEAARAGESGKGFAVVASEIRKLAERSQQAASEITNVSSSSLSISRDAGARIEHLVGNIKNTAALVQEIRSASKEQALGAEQITKAISQLDQVIQQNASSAEEMSSTALELSQQATLLNHTIQFFTIKTP